MVTELQSELLNSDVPVVDSTMFDELLECSVL